MPGNLSVHLCDAYGIIEFIKTKKFPQTILLLPSVSKPKPHCTLCNFTLSSQRKICFLSKIDAEGQEEGVETTVNCK